ncbi:MAG: hypothetical protein Ct9H300mP29_8560 [Candidatus Neomarinimicrobiota bacterium]|nr:MAG: hypothetical protein Ct9H300mP29_8560 [Candidatus Neomarinimicrobiota bacterium]
MKTPEIFKKEKLEEIGSILDNFYPKRTEKIIEDYNKGLLTPDSIPLILAKAGPPRYTSIC